MVPESSVPLLGLPNHLSRRVLELYSEIDRQTSEFRRATGIVCPPGCGECCLAVVPRVSVIELLPAAEESFLRGEAESLLERIALVGEDGRCVFFSPDPFTLGNGRCTYYEFRPSVCRLFAYGTVKSKGGKPELVTCRRHKEKDPKIFRRVQEAISEGLATPKFDQFLLQIFALDPSRGLERVPINQALRLALERCGLTIRFGSPSHG